MGKAFDTWRTRLFDGIFGRSRSAEFKEGMLAAIQNMENLGTFGYRMRRCPYAAGTASCDAWFAGVREGKKVWYIRQAVGRRKVRNMAGGSAGR